MILHNKNEYEKLRAKIDWYKREWSCDFIALVLNYKDYSVSKDEKDLQALLNDFYDAQKANLEPLLWIQLYKTQEAKEDEAFWHDDILKVFAYKHESPDRGEMPYE